MEWLWWVGAGVLLGVVEMLTLSLVFLMLAGGALGAAIPCALGAPLYVQVITFAVVSLLLLFLVRPFALRHLKKPPPGGEGVGIDAHIGKVAVVVMPVTKVSGRVKLDGEVWTARTDGEVGPIPVGATVTVIGIDGATAVVEPS